MRYLNLASHSTLLILLGLLSACATPATRSFQTAERLESEGKFEAAMYSYADSFKADPTITEPRIRFFNNRVKAADQRYKQGMDFVAKGNYVDALVEFQAAQGIDPTQGRFAQQIEVYTRYRDAQMAYSEGHDFEKGNKLKDAHRQYIRAAELFPNNAEFQAALERVTKLRKSKLEGYELRLKSNKPITLKFKDAKMKDVFKILSQLSGINFVFDEGIKDSPITILLENASFQQALDLLTTMNKLNTKNLNESTVLVYLNTPDKSKQYEDMVLRTFHLNYMEAKKAINLIRTMIQVRKAYVNEDSNSIVVRDTEDVVAVVEKILDANDMPEAEVVLDVEIVEISDKNAENIGLLLSNYNVQLGMFSPDNKLMATSLTGITVSSGSGTGTTATVSEAGITNLVKAFSTKGYGGYVTVPNMTFNFGKTLAKGEVLSNPKIRVKNKEKAKFNVGTRVPITTTTLNGTLSQVNVQYVDVGIKVNAEPNIQLNNEISIKLNLEVSSIVTKETVGGKDSATTVVTIGTRNIDTVLSLKDGETSVIGGLIQRSANSDKNKTFLLSDLPLIGPFFTNTNSSKDKTELMLAITPRLVRGVPVPLPGLASFVSGKEDHPSLDRPLSSFDQEAVFDDNTLPKSGAKNTPPVPLPMIKKTAVPTPVPEIPAAQSNVPGSSVQRQPVPSPVPPSAAPTAVPKPAPAAIQRSLLQIAAPSSVPVGQQFSLDIKISGANDLASAPFVLTYDPNFVEFVSINEGALLKSDGKPTTFGGKADSAAGTVNVTLHRATGNTGISGGGTLATALFKAKNKGPAGFAFKNTMFTSSNGGGLNILPFSTAVDIR
ncbi:MAG: cohesin domain-containing protein [Desulfuromonadaceae bacterium]|nr:cohesin domain-containing protein [Desulfuromonadaceae bacterium]